MVTLIINNGKKRSNRNNDLSVARRHSRLAGGDALEEWVILRDGGLELIQETA
jgi:hypothetical protein